MAGPAPRPRGSSWLMNPLAEQLALMLWEAGRPSLFIPPRWAPWPEALRVPLRGFNTELEAQLRWG